MKTFVFGFEVKPTELHPNFLVIKSGTAIVFALANNISHAQKIGMDYLKTQCWHIVSPAKDWRETTLADWSANPEGKLLFEAAQRHGISTSIAVCAADNFSGADYSGN